jgi:purine-binding chemotaxis protein CheW
MTTTTTPLRGQILIFVLAGEEYALDILRVREIIRYTKPTRVPGMPAAVRGLINLRGRVVPVIDLSVRFGFPDSVITERTSIVMVETTSQDGEVVIGIITDAVTAVLELTDDQVQPTPSFGTKVGAEFLEGMAEKGDQKFVMLLNIDRVLGAGALEPASS